MKNKKGFVFGILGLIYLVLIIGILVLLIWFGFRISDGISAVMGFIKEWWWVILIVLGSLLFYRQIQTLLNFTFKKLGIR